jgi:hypothetical protein
MTRKLHRERPAICFPKEIAKLTQRRILDIRADLIPLVEASRPADVGHSELDRIDQGVDVLHRVVQSETCPRRRCDSQPLVQHHRAVMTVACEHAALIETNREILGRNAADGETDDGPLFFRRWAEDSQPVNCREPSLSIHQ